MPAERAQLLELAERVEKAEGACRELDGEIWCAINGFINYGWDEIGLRHEIPGLAIGRIPALEVPAFTSRLDAALTLYVEVPTLIHSTPRWVVRDALRALAAQHPEEGSSDAG
jgi:hypothetical protein